MRTPDIRSAAIIVLLITLPLVGCSDQPAGAVQTAAATSAAAQSAPTASGPAGQLADNGDAIRLASDYTQKCAGQQKPSDAWEELRDLLVAEVSTALQTIQRSGDQRGVEQALAALEFPSEPELFIAACQILGKFSTTPGIAYKVLPQLLENRYLEVQRAAANLLTAIPDAGVVDVGQLWLRNHSKLTATSAYDEYPDFPAHYAGIGFPQYPGAAWFSPADSDGSVGWSTKDDVATVTKWFSESLKTDAMDASRWLQRQGQQAVASMQSIDPSKMERMQKLMERVVKGDQAAVAEFEKLQAEIKKEGDAITAAMENAVANRAMPPDSVVSQARWIVAKQKGNHVAGVVVVYPLKNVQRTVIQLAWDLGDYPSAWPKTGN